ncbi:MAG: hypothetical protein KDE34_23640, partial [Anaerolineales bacterium]|nr:hypothetical protein [Anaerolineales bacterium]
GGEPDWPASLGHGTHLHLYGKKEARPGRKMGHITALGHSVTEAMSRAQAARQALTGASE